MRALVLATLGLIAAACGGPPPEAPQNAGPRPVRVQAVEPTVAVRSLTAIGTLEPEARVAVSSQQEGLVAEVTVREGDAVTAGQVLVRLDDRELEALLAEARAAAEEAEARYRRTLALRASGLMPEAEEDAARAGTRIAAARVEVLETRLGFSRIEAPVAGTVITRHIEVGDLAAPRVPLLELAAGVGLRLRVPVSELDVVHLAPGDRAEVTVDALPGLVLDARIVRVFPSADPTTRQVTVELELEKAPRSVRIGFLARARLELERRDAAILVAEDAVQRAAETGAFVWVADGDVARVRPVTLGWRLGGRVVVESGLAAGDELILEGWAALRDGGPIRRLGGAEGSS